jgi:beta-fructofuranosidase
MSDPTRPTFHFTADGWLNDVIPFRDPRTGAYHLMADFNPVGTDWTPHSTWVHAVTRDFVRWRRLPDALTPTPGACDAHGCWTGCVTEHGGAYYAHYTAISHWPPAGFAAPFAQHQAVATSRDLLAWEKPAIAAPAIAGPPPGFGHCFRDPCVWREGERWRMIVGSQLPGDAGGAALLYESDDLLQWRYLHPLATGRTAETGYDFECPDFFPLGDRHVLITSRGPNRWQSGTYRDDRFAMQHYGITDGGVANGESTFYAAKTVPDDRGRRLLIGWVRDARPAEVRKASGWAGTWSIPRVLSMRADGSLGYEPLETLAAMRRQHWRFEDVRLDPQGGTSLHLLDGVAADAFELDVRFGPAPDAETLGVVVRAGDEGDEGHEGTSVTYDVAARSLGIMPLVLGDGEGLRLRVFVDRSIVEAFANGRACWTGMARPHEATGLRVGLRASGRAPVVATSVDVWSLSSA